MTEGDGSPPGSPTNDRPFPNCYCVPNSGIIAGEYPVDSDKSREREKIDALLNWGVEVFIDLTEEGELPSYESLLREEAQARGVSADYIRFPMRDFRIPGLRDMQRLLGLIANLQQSGKKIYLHCWGGVGRTGTVVGCYLVDRGYSPDESLDLVRRLFRQMSPEKLERHPDGSPETDAQRTFVRLWAKQGSKSASAAP